MANGLIEGWLGSLRRRVRREIRTYVRENTAIRHSRYSVLQRGLRLTIAGRSLQSFLATYLVIDSLFVATEVAANSHFASYLPGWTSPELKSLLKDIASYLIAAQVGILGVVSVAIGIVTLIAQRDDRSSTNTDVRLYYMRVTRLRGRCKRRRSSYHPVCATHVAHSVRRPLVAPWWSRLDL